MRYLVYIFLLLGNCALSQDCFTKDTTWHINLNENSYSITTESTCDSLNKYIVMEFYYNGKLENKYTRINDTVTYHESYLSNGWLSSKGKMIQDKTDKRQFFRTGEWVEYLKKGEYTYSNWRPYICHYDTSSYIDPITNEKITQITTTEGCLYGTVKVRDLSGKLLKQEEYRNGILISSETYD